MNRWIFNCILFLFIFLVNANVSSSEIKGTYCENLFNEIKNKQISNRLDLEPTPDTDGWDSGIILKLTESDDEKDLILERDSNGYPIVFSTRYYNEKYEVFEIFEILKHNDKITSLNGEKTNLLTDDSIFEIIYPEYDDGQKIMGIQIEYLNDDNVLNKVDINPTESAEKYTRLSLLIDGINNLDPIVGEFEVSSDFNYSWFFQDLVPIISELNDKLGVSDAVNLDWLTYCEFKPEEFYKLYIWMPGLDFSAKISEPIYESNDFYIIEYWPADETYSYPYNEENVRITYQWDGNTVLQSDFDFKAFPFDTQLLEIPIVKRRWDPYPLSLETLVRSYEKLDLEKIDNLSDWKFVSKELTFNYYYDDYMDDYMPKYTIELRIQRSFFYYIYKIFLPIFLILIVAWSALWIRPAELESRLTITIVCLLSLIAYNYVYDKDLPKLDYITLLDYIILLSYAFAAIPTIISVISFIRFVKDNDSNPSLDRIARIIGPIIFLISALVITFAMTYNNESTSMLIRSIQGF